MLRSRGMVHCFLEILRFAFNATVPCICSSSVVPTGRICKAKAQQLPLALQRYTQLMRRHSLYDSATLTVAACAGLDL